MGFVQGEGAAKKTLRRALGCVTNRVKKKVKSRAL